MLYLGFNLAGKINFDFLQKIFMGAEGANLKSLYFKEKKGLSFDTDHILLECIHLSRLRQNEKISRENLYKVTLDFDEFAMFIC